MFGAPRITLLLSFTLGVAALPGWPGGPDWSGQAEQGARREIQRLIGKLGSERYREREEAARRLAGMEEARPALQKALEAPDLELQRRAQRILDVLDRRKEDRLFQQRLALGVDGFIDQMVLQKNADDSWWKAALRLAEQLAAEARAKGGKDFRPPRFNFMVFRRATADRRKEKFGVGGERLTANTVSANFISASVIVCRGTVRADMDLTNSIVFANGDIIIDGGIGLINKCIIFCDGDVQARRVNGSVIVTSGAFKLLNSGDKNSVRGSWIREHARDPSAVVKLFDPAQVGVAVQEGKGGARVQKVHAGRAFAKAGLQVGDVVTAVEGTKVASADEFRRLLRRAVIGGRAAMLTVRRADAVWQVSARFAD